MPERAGVVVVDAANVVGARPDGWWRDRPGAAGRLVAQVAAARAAGAEGLAGARVVVVLEGRAAAAETADAEDPGAVEVLRAPRDGDAAIVDLVSALAGPPGEGGPARVVVVTSDRELRRRVAALGATTRGAGWLRDLLDAR
ncbi:MAG: NYN domain-containing protein [Actinomycetales bacterium]|nr:NYN domain-containing protein [Actinomycetales bacterium]